MIFGSVSGGFGASRGGPIRTIQHDLATMGLPVRPTGVLDDGTVNAINSVFADWSDVPPKFRTGRLTKHDVAKNAGSVMKYVRLAARGAMNVEAGSY